MNPLFAAHLIADFLLQPKWLVSWKEKSAWGAVIHAGIHAVIMALLLPALNTNLAAAVFAIACLHGIIDILKVRYQRTHPTFELAFFLDQVAHLFVLLIMVESLRIPLLPFWMSEQGYAMLGILMFMSYGIALGNLSNLEKFPLRSREHRLKRVLLVTVVFALFIVPPRLLAA